MNDSKNHYVQRLTTVGKLIQQRARKTKLLLLRGCVPSVKRQDQEPAPFVTVCDGETQTTPTIQKSFSFDDAVIESKVLPMPSESCIVDSSRDSLCSDSFDESSKKFEDERVEYPCSCKCSLDGNALMEKLLDLQQEISLINNKLCSLKAGESGTSCSAKPDVSSSIPPFVPPLPPPLPLTPNFHRSRSVSQSLSLQMLPQKPLVSKINFDEFCSRHDKDKPFVTLEDLQKVKLRQVSHPPKKGVQLSD